MVDFYDFQPENRADHIITARGPYRNLHGQCTVNMGQVTPICG